MNDVKCVFWMLVCISCWFLVRSTLFFSWIPCCAFVTYDTHIKRHFGRNRKEHDLISVIHWNNDFCVQGTSCISNWMWFVTYTNSVIPNLLRILKGNLKVPFYLNHVTESIFYIEVWNNYTFVHHKFKAFPKYTTTTNHKKNEMYYFTNLFSSIFLLWFQFGWSSS